jgi:hypothetical protein
MWKAFIECCCGVPERAAPHSKTPIRTKTTQTTSRAHSTSSRADTIEIGPESASSSNSIPKKRRVVATAAVEESESSSEAISASIASATASCSPSSEEETPLCTGKNYLFYQNQIPSKPSPGGFIDDIHKNWFSDYRLLEYHHGYIQVCISNAKVI